MTTSTRQNNRALTLAGANNIFSAIGVTIEKSDLGFYQAEMRGQVYQSKTLTELCQSLVKALLAAKPLPLPGEQ